MLQPWPRRQFLSTAFGVGLIGPLRAVQPPAKPKADGLLVRVEPPQPPPKEVFRRLGSMQMRVESYVHGLSFSPTGQSLVVADRQFMLAYDPTNGTLKHKLKYPAGDVSSGVADDEFITLLIQRDTAPQKFGVHTFSMMTGQETRYQSLPLTFTRAFVFSPDAAYALQSQDGHAVCYDCRTGRELWKRPAGTETHQFFPSSDLALVWKPSELEVVESRSGKPLKRLKAKDGSNIGNEIVASPDRRWVAAVSSRNQDAICIWNVETGAVVGTFPSTGSPLGFSPDSRQLYAPSKIGVQVWDLNAGKIVRELDLGNCREAKLSPDGLHLVNHSSNALWVFSTETGQLKAYSADPPGQAQNLHFVDNNTLQAEVNAVNSWIRWSIPSGQATMFRLANQGQWNQLALSSDGRQGVYQDEKAGLVTVRQLSDRKELHRVEESSGQAVATPDGQWLFVMAGERAELVHPQTGKQLRLLGLETANTVELTPDGRFVAAITSAADGNDTASVLSVVEAATNRAIFRRTLAASPSWLSVSDNGQRYAVGWNRYAGGVSEDLKGAAIIYQVGATNEIARIKPGSNATAERSRFSPCGRMITIGLDNGLEIYEVLTGQLRLRIKTGWSLDGCAFSPDRRLVAISGIGGPVWLWDFLGDRTSPVPALTPPQLPELWAALLRPDGQAAFQAIRTLARNPKLSLPYLDQLIQPPENISLTRVKSLIQQLDSSSFKQREEASRELGKLGEAAVPMMQEYLETSEADEQRRRLELLLKSHHLASPEQVRLARLVELVEWSAVPAATKLLEKWSQGLYPRPLSNESAAALARLSLAGRRSP